MARPSEYTQADGDAICDAIAGGESLRAYCRKTGLAQQTVFGWLRQHDSFREQYTRARIEQADADADAIGDIADRTLSGEVDPQAARVAIDALKWSAGKRNAPKYGDRLALDHSGSIAQVSETELESRLAKLLGKAGATGAAGGESPAQGEE